MNTLNQFFFWGPQGARLSPGNLHICTGTYKKRIMRNAYWIFSEKNSNFIEADWRVSYSVISQSMANTKLWKPSEHKQKIAILVCRLSKNIGDYWPLVKPCKFEAFYCMINTAGVSWFPCLHHILTGFQHCCQVPARKVGPEISPKNIACCD
jgi:hypothetical protein